MLPVIIAAIVVLVVIGGVGAARQQVWALFLLFPALGALLATPVVGGAVIVLMATVELVSGAPVRDAYQAEPFWTAACLAGMGAGALFALAAVAAQPR